MQTIIRRFVAFTATLSAVLAVSTTGFAQQFVQKTYQDAQGVHKYAVFIPARYQPGRPTPTVLFLHGAGERGTDGQKPTLVGIGPYLKAKGSSIPYLVIFPQAEETQGRALTPWLAGEPDAERALKILDEVSKQFTVDKQRVSLAGWSMGGYGAWSLAAAHPERWAGVAILSGGGDPKFAAAVKSLPLWVFHGYRDHLVPLKEAHQMVTAVKDAGGDIVYNELPDAGHDLFAETFGNEALLNWFADPRKLPRTLSKSPPIKVPSPPFVPAVRIPNSVGIRLGNTALDALSYAAPSYVPPNLLTGRINDMFDSTTAQGRNFSVQFTGISYSGQLGRVEIRATGKDRVHLALGLRNVFITVGGTYVTGQRHSAQAGPVTIGIGQARPVYLSMDATPYVENGKLRMRLIQANFSISPDNYSVSAPAGVWVRGLGMREDVVSNGIVSGLYGARPRVENEVRNIAPTILRQLEDNLVASDIGPIVAGLWPFPVYQPRLRTYFEQVSTDENGVSVVMGVEAAAVDPTVPPKKLVTSPSAGVTLDHLKSGGTSLGVALAPQLMGPITQSLIDAGLAQLDVLDLPEKSFGRFSDREFLEGLLPDMKRLEAGTEVRTRVALAAPLLVDRPDNGNGQEDPLAVPLHFKLPQVAMQIATRSPNKKWEPYAQFDLMIDELVTVGLKKVTHERRALEMQWQEGRSITGKGAFAPGANPTDTTIKSDEFVAAFKENWQAWTGSGPAATATVPDVEFSTTKLRLQQLSGPAPVLTGVFEIPGTRITNFSDAPLVYEIRGPYTVWGGPYTLEPGKTHEYDFPHPLTYRQSSGPTRDNFTLVAGSYSIYGPPKKGGPPRLYAATASNDGQD